MTVMSYVYEKEYSSSASADDWTKSYVFFNRFAQDAQITATRVTNDADYKAAAKRLKDAKEKNVNEAYKRCQQFKKELISDYEAYVEEEYDEDGEPVNETTAFNEERFEQYNKEHPSSEFYEVTIGNYGYGGMDIFSTDTKEDLSERYDGMIDDWASAYVTADDYGSRSNEICCYASFGNQKDSNVDDFSEEKAYSSDIYYILKNGKVEYNGIDSETADGVTARVKGATENADKVTLYLYLPKVSELNKTSFSAALRNEGNEYSIIKQFHTEAAKYYDGVAKYLAITVILLALSFIFGIFYFNVTGKKNDADPARLFFYDYVPFEIGAGIAGGLGTLAGVVVIESLNSQFIDVFTSLSPYIILAFGCVCWLLLFMLTSSTIRYARSDRKLYRHFVTFWVVLIMWKVLVFIWKILVKFFKWIGGLLAKLGRWFNETFMSIKYKPTKFKRNIIRLACLWLGGNALLLFIGGALYFYGRAPLLTAIIYIGVIVGDVLVLRKVCDYIKNLDKIIDASSRHEDVMLDMEKLDNSLRVLAESMRYTNAELQNAINKAVKDERLRTELITNVSHDLKTPLTSIITYVDLLSKCDIKDEKALEYIKVLDEKGGKLKRLIDDLIEASKVTSGNVTVNPAPMNLTELCLQATVDAQSDFEKAGLELVVKQGEKPVVVFADGTKTNRIIENLLSNARKYSAKASRVYVTVYEENGNGVFEIKNVSAQPLDITPEELTERFVRGDESRTKDGNGLGLSIAKELANLQNGKLELVIDGDLFKARVILPKK